jgi:hypothetical protein
MVLAESDYNSLLVLPLKTESFAEINPDLDAREVQVHEQHGEL